MSCQYINHMDNLLGKGLRVIVLSFKDHFRFEHKKKCEEKRKKQNLNQNQRQNQNPNLNLRTQI